MSPMSQLNSFKILHHTVLPENPPDFSYFKAAESEKVLEQREFAAAGSIPADTAELRIKPPNLELLRRLATATHGAFDASAATIARHGDQTVAFRRSADPWLIPLVIMLFLGEVFVRRRYLGD